MIINLFERLLDLVNNKRMSDLGIVFSGKQYPYKQLQKFTDFINLLKNKRDAPKLIGEKLASDMLRFILESKCDGKDEAIDALRKELLPDEIKQFIVILQYVLTTYPKLESDNDL